jgi:predicted nuclease of predicted toxin-antitoxin system
MLRILLDKNVGRKVGLGLNPDLADIRHVSDKEQCIGKHDPQIWRHAVEHQAVLVTHDWPDFTGLLSTTRIQTLPLPLAVLRYNYRPDIEALALRQFVAHYDALAEVAGSIRARAQGRVFAAIEAGPLKVTFYDTCMGQGNRGKKVLGPSLACAQFLARRRGAFALRVA